MLFVPKLPTMQGAFDAIYKGKVHDDTGFINTMNHSEELTGPHPIFLSVEGLRNIAEKFPQVGLVDVGRYDALAREHSALQAEADAMRAHIDDLEARFDRINGLKRDGFTIVRQQGRPPKRS